MITIQKTDARNQDFIKLVKDLDAYLAVSDGDDHAFYDQFNQLDSIKYAIVAYEDSIPIGCGAIKLYDEGIYEVKRMFVDNRTRGKGVASQILDQLEIWAKEMGGKKCILETGIRQVEAIHLYQKCGYTKIANYGQYLGVEESFCFSKELR